MNIAHSQLQCDFCANVIYEESNYLNSIIIGVYDCSPVFYLGRRLIACPICVENIKAGKSIIRKYLDKP
jgi:hypothetical protein